MKPDIARSVLHIAITFSCILLSSEVRAFRVFVDPGHGGDDPGPCTYIEGYCEKTINYQVGLRLKDSLDAGLLRFSYMFSRLNDTTTIANEMRALAANNFLASAYVAIHHNTPPDTSNHTAQYSLTLYCNSDTVIGGEYSGWSRNGSDTLARKVLYRIRDAFQYKVQDTAPWNNCGFLVLKQTYMASTISEASFISQFCEADEFYYNMNEHREEEAGALYSGILSYKDGQGFANVNYAYLDPWVTEAFPLEVDGWLATAPYESCWLLNEWHTVYAIPFYKDGYTYTFHHWIQRDAYTGWVLDETDVNPYTLVVDWDSDHTHWYTAVFTGGDFWTRLVMPFPFTTEIDNNDTTTIMWDACPGVLNSCSVYVDLSTDNKRTWSRIAGPLPYDNGMQGQSYKALDGTNYPNVGKFLWHTPNIVSDSCFLRISGKDIAENQATFVSHRFSLAGCWRPIYA